MSPPIVAVPNMALPALQSEPVRPIIGVCRNLPSVPNPMIHG
jgi:hypothetical protein